MDEFSPAEREMIENAFAPLGNISAESMVRSKSPKEIGNLVGHLKKEHLRHLGYRLIERADALLTDRVGLLDRHFYLAARGDFFYRWRNHDEFALEQAISSFQRQIEIAPEVADHFRADQSWGFVPAHAGYRQMRIIEEKRGNLDDAQKLCEQAKSEGWVDDWDHHIARIARKRTRKATVGRE